MSRSKDVEPRVRKLLEDYPELRNNDKLLIMQYLRKYHGLVLDTTQQQILLSSTPFESITRARRNLRAEFPGNKEVEEQRYQNFKQEQQDHSLFKWRLR